MAVEKSYAKRPPTQAGARLRRPFVLCFEAQGRCRRKYITVRGTKAYAQRNLLPKLVSGKLPVAV